MSHSNVIRLRAGLLVSGVAFLSAIAAFSSHAANAAPGSVASCLTSAQAVVKQAEAPLHFTLSSQKVKMSANAGKTIWDVSPTLSNQLQAAVAQGVVAAGKTAGMSVKTWDGKNSVPTENQGVSEAVSQGAKGIILQSVTVGLISGPFGQAKKAKIPVINWTDDDPTAPLNGVDARVTSNFTKDGTAMAAYALAHSNCNTHALVLYPGQFPNNVDIYRGFSSEMKKLCPSCNVTAVAINPATMATTVGPLVQAAIRRDPQLRWVVPTFDYLATFIVPAIDQMGSQGQQVHIIGHDGNPANLAYISKHDVQVADIAFPPAQYQGWVLVDQVARLMAGQKPVPDVVPTQLVDSTNLPSTSAKLYAKFGNYQAAFKKLWGK